MTSLNNFATIYNTLDEEIAELDRKLEATRREMVTLSNELCQELKKRYPIYTFLNNKSSTYEGMDGTFRFTWRVAKYPYSRIVIDFHFFPRPHGEEYMKRRERIGEPFVVDLLNATDIALIALELGYKE